VQRSRKRAPHLIKQGHVTTACQHRATTTTAARVSVLAAATATDATTAASAIAAGTLDWRRRHGQQQKLQVVHVR
jgi:hypothetical protein